jgi:site-specific DNA-cytosine methylase
VTAGPTMAEIRATPWRGLTAASLFSGAGGLSLGFMMAGFCGIYANDSDRFAAEVYRLNLGTEGWHAPEANRVRVDPLDPRTGHHLGQCEFASETDAAMLRVLLKVTDKGKLQLG